MMRFHLNLTNLDFLVHRGSIYNIHRGFKRHDTPSPDPELLGRKSNRRMILEAPRFPGEFDTEYPPKGRVYDKKPFKMYLEAGKKYAWCTCGEGNNQPMCDGTHKRIAETGVVKKKPIFRPIIFKVDESKEYFLCNCKQTNNRPFCDATHRKDRVQKAKLSKS